MSGKQQHEVVEGARGEEATTGEETSDGTVGVVGGRSRNSIWRD